ncbi:hypothetical protein [Nonomuraea soli]|uniref:Uncharacterized protein n=1 Tax=Nonomuraea soli TaxID=1032476 RepID=A0A7W0CUY2_9ACTN|nr:hypothetical protein [Nonomuraea soli]MBA2897720.1 hypothetical protein [Nonomuraea soli]
MKRSGTLLELSRTPFGVGLLDDATLTIRRAQLAQAATEAAARLRTGDRSSPTDHPVDRRRDPTGRPADDPRSTYEKIRQELAAAHDELGRRAGLPAEAQAVETAARAEHAEHERQRIESEVAGQPELIQPRRDLGEPSRMPAAHDHGRDLESGR